MTSSRQSLAPLANGVFHPPAKRAPDAPQSTYPDQRCKSPPLHHKLCLPLLPSLPELSDCQTAPPPLPRRRPTRQGQAYLDPRHILHPDGIRIVWVGRLPHQLHPLALVHNALVVTHANNAARDGAQVDIVVASVIVCADRTSPASGGRRTAGTSRGAPCSTVPILRQLLLKVQAVGDRGDGSHGGRRRGRGGHTTSCRTKEKCPQTAAALSAGGGAAGRPRHQSRQPRS